ncbi:hypothetical protein [Klebsiella aerogenes]|uniref:hypothetical protein n=2 Tax=Gammaproteobacteria TaxID=1236 RepID=UPI00378C82E0
MNVGPTNSARAAGLRSYVLGLQHQINEQTRKLRQDKRILARYHKELAELAVQERRDRLHALLVESYPDGIRVDSDALLADYVKLARLRVGSHDTLRQDLLALVAGGCAWRRAIAASPKPGRVFVYGPVIAK